LLGISDIDAFQSVLFIGFLFLGGNLQRVR
jgi:hypothetical protein